MSRVSCLIYTQLFCPRGCKRRELIFNPLQLDPGNLGSIIRTAFFLGVDALFLNKKTCAPLTPTALKSSAGAAEALPIHAVDLAASFLDISRRAGWRVIAADWPSSSPTNSPSSSRTTFKTGPRFWDHSSSTAPALMLRSNAAGRKGGTGVVDKDFPTILILGGEGEGLRQGLKTRIDGYVGVSAGRDIQMIGLDSLNVGVAAGVVVWEVLRKMKGRS
ncbi:Alpha/beta knot methyltransferase [Lineolata rhizophorae]|uniref:Alpha/beta knot methyltransferase n=1 Tax=Lineolata rhizophorae TaxID=578093 RepID=A0A6A6P417_9PEZI|nr:Alpha/beta knot methyltransferase [Lineolata rhizophorae]